jgi:hypothetical protein
MVIPLDGRSVGFLHLLTGGTQPGQRFHVKADAAVAISSLVFLSWAPSRPAACASAEMAFMVSDSESVESWKEKGDQRARRRKSNLLPACSTRESRN